MMLKNLHIESLSEMQQAAFDAMTKTSKHDVVLLSPTGSGKTLAYLLPLINSITTGGKKVEAVVVVPGRELAIQSAEVLRQTGSGIRGMALYGGRPTMDEHRKLRQVEPQIVFGTPGRLNDHLEKQNFDADTVRTLVIDEFDKCLEMGFQDEMAQLIAKLPNVNRRFLLSATQAEEIPRFVRISSADVLDFTEESSSRVTLFEVRSPNKDKLETLGMMLRQFGSASTIVFLNYRESVERTNDWLRNEGFSTSIFHGGLDQREREDSLFKFSNGSSNILVSTDLGSRGLDIPQVENIIQYHLPETQDNYIHRIGRTARWDATGKAFFLLGPEEKLPEYVSGVEPFTVVADGLPIPKSKMATLYIGKGKRDKVSRGDIVGFLCKKGGLTSNDIGRIDVRERYCYCAIVREKLREVLRNVEGEKIKGLRTVVESIK